MTRRNRILVVDDDRAYRQLIRSGLEDQDYEVVSASSVAECMNQISKIDLDLLLLDLHLPGGYGMDVLKRVRAAHPELPIIFITGSEDSDSAILAARFGARDYLTKPISLTQLHDVVRKSLSQNRYQTEEDEEGFIAPANSDDPFIGRSREMQAVFKSIGRIAKRDVAVLVQGESGTGKELVARAIWQHGDRANKVFLAVNCAAMSSDLLESEMFGHEKGAFTGADRQHIGKFEACSDGTLFLDEVGDMPLPIQAKLLRVLQERTFTRVGGNEQIRTGARIISATNRNLKTMCSTGDFRGDLLHRLNEFTIHVPALRQRSGDLRCLIAHFLDRNNRKLSKQFRGISASAAERLGNYGWPGNVRELEAVISQVMLNTHHSVIRERDLPTYLSVATSSHSADVRRKHSKTDSAQHHSTSDLETLVDSFVQQDAHDVYAQVIQHVERVLLVRVLNATQGNQTAAAKRLGITRGSLRFKLKNLGLKIDSEISMPHRPK